MLKLKLQYFGHLMGRVDSLEKTLMLGKIENKRIREWAEDKIVSITDSMDMSLSNLQEIVQRSLACSMGLQPVRRDLTTEQVTSRSLAARGSGKCSF